MVLDSALVRRVRKNARLRPLGIAAYRTLMRVRPARPGPRVLANSIPKAGTHLLMSLLDAVPGMRFSGLHVAYRDYADHPDPVALMTDEMRRDLRGLRTAQYMSAHVLHDAEIARVVAEDGCVHLLVVRDPRDIALSLAAYVARYELHPLHERFVTEYPDAERQVEAVIRGIPTEGPRRGLQPIASVLDRYRGWLAEPDVCVVRFEDLVGARGGGDDAVQRATVARVLGALGQHTDDATVARLCEQAYSPTAATFRRGRIGAWHDEMSPANQALMRELAGDEIAMLGYAR